MTGRYLLADVGGTNVRLCSSAMGGRLEDVRALQVAAYGSFGEALAAYREAVGLGAQAGVLSGVRIAAAGPVASGRVALTNAPWIIDAAEIAAQAGAPVTLFNDLEAVGHFLPHVGDGDVTPIGGDWTIGAPATRIAVNVGTGFGAATAHFNASANWSVTPSEAGHMSLKASRAGDDTRSAGALVADFTSVEDLLSGGGVLAAYARASQAEAGHASRMNSAVSAAELFANAAHDVVAGQVARLFSRALGTSVGDLVLAHAAWGGAFLCGSVVGGWRSAGLETSFREAFADKGKMAARMASVPTWYIIAEQPALLGLSYVTE